MDQPSRFLHEGTRTFVKQGVTIEIVVMQLYMYGLFEVSCREQKTLFEFRPVYLRSCIIEQRVTASLSNSSPGSIGGVELQHLRALIFNDISDRLMLIKKGSSSFYEMEYVPAPGDLEFGPDKTFLNQLICDSPYRSGAPASLKKM